MNRFFTFIILITLIPRTGLSQKQDTIAEFSTYLAMRAHFGKLYQEKEYEKAAEVLEIHIGNFPDHLQANAYNLAVTYGRLGQLQKGIGVLQSAMACGAWFNKYAFEHGIWDPYKGTEGLKLIQNKNETMRLQAQRSAKAEMEIITPEGYDTSKSYPLFIALHGGNGNIGGFKTTWTSELMRTEFISAYLQSSQIISPDGFNWTEDIEISKKEIVEAYTKISAEFAINENEIIIGGFSSGGVAAMEVVLCNRIPATGFVVLCPDKPESFTAENIESAVIRKIRGTIITTEMDPRLDIQQEMAEMFKKAGLQYQFVVTPNLGHWIPDDFHKMIDDAIISIEGL